jgi:hypothetical protein
MSPSAETIIRDAHQAGVTLTLTPVGTIKLSGNKAAVVKWAPAIRDYKPEILTALQAANDTDHEPLPDAGMEKRRRYVLRMLEQNPEINRATMADGDADPVRVHLAVRGVGTCELSIAADRWDEFKFLELLEKMDKQA